MPEPPERQRYLAPLFDRLRDPVDPRPGEEPPLGGYPLSKLKDSVREDLERLLNTRRTLDGPLEEMGELATSCLSYGLPDLTPFGLDTEANCRAVSRMIKEAVGRFDPRLTEVDVSVPQPSSTDAGLTFSIRARLQVRPKAVEVEYDSVLDVATRTFSVRGDAPAARAAADPAPLADD